MRLTTKKPTRCDSVSGYPLHRGTITLRGATPEQVATADAAARTAGATVTRDPHDAARWCVRQAPRADADGGGFGSWGGADHDLVECLTADVANAVRAALGLPVIDD